MALSYATYTGDGVTNAFPIPFPYLEREHVYVIVGNTMPGFTWFNPQLIGINTGPPAPGAAVKVFRSTPKEIPVVTFWNDQEVDVERFNDGLRQALYVAQELEDLNGSVIGQYTQIIATGAGWYDLSASIPYTPYQGELLFVHAAARTLTIPAGFAGSRAVAVTAPASTAQTLTIYKDTSPIGSISFPVGATSGTVTGSATVIPPGSSLRIKCSTPPDNVFRDIGITLSMIGTSAP